MIHLFWTFLVIGTFSIGGGYAIIPLIQEQVVNQQHWINEQVFTDIITISNMTPGPLAVNTSTFVGMQLFGIPGAIVATVGCILSGVVLSLALMEFFRRKQGSLYVDGVLQGLKATSVGLIMAAGLTIVALTFFGVSQLAAIQFQKLDLIAVGLFAVSLVLMRKTKLNPILLMVLCGVAGAFFY